MKDKGYRSFPHQIYTEDHETNQAEHIPFTHPKTEK